MQHFRPREDGRRFQERHIPASSLLTDPLGILRPALSPLPLLVPGIDSDDDARSSHPWMAGPHRKAMLSTSCPRERGRRVRRPCPQAWLGKGCQPLTGLGFRITFLADPSKDVAACKSHRRCIRTVDFQPAFLVFDESVRPLPSMRTRLRLLRSDCACVKTRLPRLLSPRGAMIQGVCACVHS